MLNITDLAVLESYIEEFKEDTNYIQQDLILNVTYLSDLEKAQIRELATKYHCIVEYSSIPCKEGTMVLRLLRWSHTSVRYHLGALTFVVRRSGNGKIEADDWMLTFRRNSCELWTEKKGEVFNLGS